MSQVGRPCEGGINPPSVKDTLRAAVLSELTTMDGVDHINTGSTASQRRMVSPRQGPQDLAVVMHDVLS